MVIEGKWAPLSRHISRDRSNEFLMDFSSLWRSFKRPPRCSKSKWTIWRSDGTGPPWIYEKYMDKFNIYVGISTHVLKYMKNVWKIYGKYIWINLTYIWLVVDLPLWKIWKSMGRIIPYIMEKKSKPPTRYMVYMGKSYLHTHTYIYIYINHIDI